MPRNVVGDDFLGTTIDNWRKVDHQRMPKSKDKQRIKELEEQVKRLTVEFAYIKKLEALIQERKSQEKKN